MKTFNLKKFFLYLLIASVAFSALLGIGVILFGNFGETESKILLTTLIITVTSILGLACGAFLETGRGKELPVSGIVLSILAAVLWIIFIWANFENGRVFIQIALSVTLLAASCSHISLLSIARLDKRFRWSLYAVNFAVWSLTALLLVIIWGDFESSSGLVERTIGVLSIVIAALTILTPVLHRLSSHAPDAEEIDAEIARLEARIEELKIKKAEIPQTDE